MSCLGSERFELGVLVTVMPAKNKTKHKTAIFQNTGCMVEVMGWS